jgi:hypothetical protein
VTTDDNDSKPLDGTASVPELTIPELTPSSDGHPRRAETWISLCAQAAVEQDPKRLLDLVSEINRLLDARRKRLAQESARNTSE